MPLFTRLRGIGILGSSPCAPSAKLSSLLRLGVCGLFFLDDLQALDHVKVEAHYAAILAPVLDVDGLIVMVDENLRENPAVVIESLSPLWDSFALYLALLLPGRSPRHLTHLLARQLAHLYTRLSSHSNTLVISLSTPRRLNVTHGSM